MLTLTHDPELQDQIERWGRGETSGLPFELDKYKPHTRKDFLEFDKGKPEIFDLFEQMCFDTVKVMKKYSGDALLHVARWHGDISGKISESEPFKINECYTPIYCRLLMVIHAPVFDEFFAIRKVRSQGIRPNKKKVDYYWD